MERDVDESQSLSTSGRDTTEGACTLWPCETKLAAALKSQSSAAAWYALPEAERGWLRSMVSDLYRLRTNDKARSALRDADASANVVATAARSSAATHNIASAVSQRDIRSPLQLRFGRNSSSIVV